MTKVSIVRVSIVKLSIIKVSKDNTSNVKVSMVKVSITKVSKTISQSTTHQSSNCQSSKRQSSKHQWPRSQMKISQSSKVSIPIVKSFNDQRKYQRTIDQSSKCKWPKSQSTIYFNYLNTFLTRTSISSLIFSGTSMLSTDRGYIWDMDGKELHLVYSFDWSNHVNTDILFWHDKKHLKNRIYRSWRLRLLQTLFEDLLGPHQPGSSSTSQWKWYFLRDRCTLGWKWFLRETYHTWMGPPMKGSFIDELGWKRR